MWNIHNLVPKLTDEVRSNVSEWYGADARLVSEKPAIECRNYSFILTYPIISNDGSEFAVLVKIPKRIVDDETNHAHCLGSDSINIRSEYETLLKISQAIDSFGSQNLFAVKALAYFEEWNVVVTEEMPCHRLKELLLSPRIFFGYGRDWAELEVLYQKVGEWLRVFHDHLGSPSSGVFKADVVAAKIDREFARIIKASKLDIYNSNIRKYFESVLDRMEGKKLTFSALHGDFASGNVLISPQGNVGSLDSPIGQRGPIYVDMGNLLADFCVIEAQLAINGLAVCFNQHRYDACVDAFLDGYFDFDEPNLAALDLFCAIAVMEKWRWNAEKIAALRRIPDQIKRFMVEHIRCYYSRILKSFLINNQGA